MRPEVVSRADSLAAELKAMDNAFGETHEDAADTTSTEAVADVLAVLKATRVISSELNLDSLLSRTVRIVAESVGAQRAAIVLVENNDLQTIVAIDLSAANETITHGRLQDTPSPVPVSLVRYVYRTQHSVRLPDARQQGPFVSDSYIVRHQTRSALCLPLRRGARVLGVVFLENNLAPGSFAPGWEKTTELLLAQPSVSLENATVFARQRDVESALRVSENNMAEAQSIAAIGLFDSGLCHDELNWSKELYRIHFKDSETFTPTRQTFANLLHPDDRDAYLSQLEESLALGEPLDAHYRIVAPDGSLRTLHTTAHVTRDKQKKINGLRGAVQDITERSRIEDSLRQSEARLKAILDTAADAIVTISEDGLITSFNRAAEESFGYTTEDVIGENVRLLLPEPYAKGHDAYLQRYRSTGIPLIIGSVRELIAKRKDNSLVPIELLVSDMRAEQIRGFTGIVRDVTERKLAEESLRQAHEQLINLQRHETELATAKLAELSQQLVRQTRLVTIGQMTASIAHEIRNPLGAVRNAAYYLKRHVPRDKPKLGQYLDIIDQEVHAADHVIRDMLQMARAKESEIESVDLSATIRGVFARMNAGADVRFELVSRPDPFMIMADPGQCYQVIFNLVTNAVHAIDGNGEIRVETRRDEDHDLITVQDNGPGMDAEHRDSLFEPLFTTKAKGTGLGLAICREIIERHEGTIELMQIDGAGALFCIKLRRHKSAE